MRLLRDPARLGYLIGSLTAWVAAIQIWTLLPLAVPFPFNFWRVIVLLLMIGSGIALAWWTLRPVPETLRKGLFWIGIHVFIAGLIAIIAFTETVGVWQVAAWFMALGAALVVGNADLETRVAAIALPEPSQQRRALVILLVGVGILGILYAIHQSELQAAVEQGQSISGMVPYAPDNPFYIYHVKAWNIWGQSAALGLEAGLNEEALSLIIAGLFGFAFFVGIALWAHSFSRNVLVTAFVLIIPVLLWESFQGFRYHLILPGARHTYGGMGMTMGLLVIGLLATNRIRLGLLVLGFAPWIHISLGFWLHVAVGLAVLWDYKRLRMWLKNAVYVLPGYALSLMSFILNRNAFPLPAVDSANSQEYIRTFTLLWDSHRSPFIPLENLDIMLVMSLSLLALCLLLFEEARQWSPAQAFGSRLIVTIMVTALSFHYLSNMLPTGNPLHVLMPARFGNLLEYLAGPTIVMILWRYRKYQFSGWLLLFWTLSTIIGIIYKRLYPEAPNTILEVNTALVAMTFALFIVYRQPRTMRLRPILFWMFIILLTSFVLSNQIHLPQILTLVSMILFLRWALKHTTALAIDQPMLINYSLTLLLMTIVVNWLWLGMTFNFGVEESREAQNNPVYLAMREGEGQILMSSYKFYQTQIFSRRPVVIDLGALNAYPYAEEGMPQVIDILDTIYDVDYFNPPVETYFYGALNELESVKTLWEERTPEEWQILADSYNFTQIVTEEDWVLDLPLVAHNEEAALYDIPGATQRVHQNLP